MSDYYPQLPCVMLTKGGTQTIATSTLTELTWATEEHDPYGMHSGSSTDIVVPATGVYLLTTTVLWASDSGGTFRQAGAYVNGVSQGSEVISSGNTSDFSAYVPYRRILHLTKGDVVSIYAAHSRGSNTTVLANSHVALVMLSKVGA